MEKAEPVAREVVCTRHGPGLVLVCEKREGAVEKGRLTHHWIPRRRKCGCDDRRCVDPTRVWEGVEHGVACENDNQKEEWK